MVDAPLGQQIDRSEDGDGSAHRYHFERDFEPGHGQDQDHGLGQHFNPAQEQQALQRVRRAPVRSHGQHVIGLRHDLRRPLTAVKG